MFSARGQEELLTNNVSVHFSLPGPSGHGLGAVLEVKKVAGQGIYR